MKLYHLLFLLSILVISISEAYQRNKQDADWKPWEGRKEHQHGLMGGHIGMVIKNPVNEHNSKKANGNG